MNNPKLSSIQHLRCLAACSVMAGHIFMEARAFGLISDDSFRLLDLFPWGIGVDLFFVISGFIICDVLSRSPRMPRAALDFLVKRLIRIVPAYWFFTALMIAAMLVMGHQVEANGLSLPHIAASFLLLPWPAPHNGELAPVLGQGWTLSYEMAFYAIAGAAILLPKDRRIGFIAAAVAALFVLANLIAYGSEPSRFLSNSVLFEFLIGVWIRRSLPVGIGLAPRARAAMAGASLPLLCLAPSLDELPRLLTHGLPATLVVMAVLRPNNAQPTSVGRLSERIGDASYALYLSHPFVINGLWLVGKGLFAGHALLFIATASLGSVVFALVFYRHVETRMSAALRRRWDSGNHARKGAASRLGAPAAVLTRLPQLSASAGRACRKSG